MRAFWPEKVSQIAAELENNQNLVRIKSRTFHLPTRTAYMPTCAMNKFPENQDERHERDSEGISSGYQPSTGSNETKESQSLQLGGRQHHTESHDYHGNESHYHHPRPPLNHGIPKDDKYYQRKPFFHLQNPYRRLPHYFPPRTLTPNCSSSSSGNKLSMSSEGGEWKRQEKEVKNARHLALKPVLDYYKKHQQFGGETNEEWLRPHSQFASLAD